MAGLLYQNPVLRGVMGARMMNEQSERNELGQIQGLLGIQQAQMQQQEMAKAQQMRGLLGEALQSGDQEAAKRVLMQFKPELFSEGLVPKAPEKVDLGGSIGYIQNGKIIAQIPKSATPDTLAKEEGAMTRHQTASGSAQLGASVNMRGQDMTDARTRSEGVLNRGVTMRGQDLGRVQFDPERGGVVDLRTNTFTPTMTTPGNGAAPAPLGPKPAKLGETQVKQVKGVENTRDAITQYRNELKKWSAVDALNPAARARMGTVYNNMLLQAKEAFNLGVLNGPDYQILQEVITNPATMTGTITPSTSLDAQAKKLDEIMSRIGTVSSTPVAPVNPSQNDPLGIRKK